MSTQRRKGKLAAETYKLPEIPAKLYFTIGEVGKLCKLQPHVLRYWEQEFPQLRPMKRRGNRRYYQKDDIELVRKIRDLLYYQGFTIDGARGQLSTSRRRQPAGSTSDNLGSVVDSLEDVLGELEQV